jgi:hypothetical protein
MSNPTTRVALTQSMTAAEAMSYVASGAVTVEDYLVWDAERIAAVERKAAARTGSKKAFKISDSPKGVVVITLPGMGMSPSLPVESLECLLENIDAVKAYLAEHGKRIASVRAAYKLTDAYKASAKSMFNAAAAAKGTSKAA